MIKTTKEVYEEYDKSLNNETWIRTQDVLAILHKDCDYDWALNQIEKALSENHSKAENIMNLITHIQAVSTKLITELNTRL